MYHIIHVAIFSKYIIVFFQSVILFTVQYLIPLLLQYLIVFAHYLIFALQHCPLFSNKSPFQPCSVQLDWLIVDIYRLTVIA